MDQHKDQVGKVKIKSNLLVDKLFLLGLLTLVLNDFFLKHQFSGLVTGKLSDVSGLFIFPFFWSIFFERHKLKVYIFTGVFFIFWKLSVSTAFISGINQILGTTFHRVVDPTDLFALFILPFSYLHFVRCAHADREGRMPLNGIRIVIMVVAVFSFFATSLRTVEVQSGMKIGESWTLNFSKKKILVDKMKALSPAQVDSGDSVFQITYSASRYTFEANIKMKTIDSENTQIEFMVLNSYTITGEFLSKQSEDELIQNNELNREDFIRLFKIGVIDAIRLRPNGEAGIYYQSVKSSDE